MIPDIAFMIVVYGSARLVTAVLEPHRRGSGTMAQVATALSWAFAVLAIGGLAVLAVDVLGNATSTPSLTR